MPPVIGKVPAPNAFAAAAAAVDLPPRSLGGNEPHRAEREAERDVVDLAAAGRARCGLGHGADAADRAGRLDEDRRVVAAHVRGVGGEALREQLRLGGGACRRGAENGGRGDGGENGRSDAGTDDPRRCLLSVSQRVAGRTGCRRRRASAIAAAARTSTSSVAEQREPGATAPTVSAAPSLACLRSKRRVLRRDHRPRRCRRRDGRGDAGQRGAGREGSERTVRHVGPGR